MTQKSFVGIVKDMDTKRANNFNRSLRKFVKETSHRIVTSDDVDLAGIEGIFIEGTTPVCTKIINYLKEQGFSVEPNGNANPTQPTHGVIINLVWGKPDDSDPKETVGNLIDRTIDFISTFREFDIILKIEHDKAISSQWIEFTPETFTPKAIIGFLGCKKVINHMVSGDTMKYFWEYLELCSEEGSAVFDLTAHVRMITKYYSMFRGFSIEESTKTNIFAVKWTRLQEQTYRTLGHRGTLYKLTKIIKSFVSKEN